MMSLDLLGFSKTFHTSPLVNVFKRFQKLLAPYIGSRGVSFGVECGTLVLISIHPSFFCPPIVVVSFFIYLSIIRFYMRSITKIVTTSLIFLNLSFSLLFKKLIGSQLSIIL